MKTRSTLVLAAGAVALSFISRLSVAADGGPSADAASDATIAPDAATKGDGAVVGAPDAARPDGAVPRDAALPPPRHVVGQACKTAKDCTAGLICLVEGTNSLGLGGPAGGLCTVDCKANGQTDCDSVDTGSVCASDASHTFAYCYELCDAGEIPAGAHKCHDRSNMGCYPSASGTSFCTPMCAGGVDCTGRACDPRSGLCVDSLVDTITLGTACDPGPPPIGCSGPCTTLGSGAGTTSNSFCSKTCIIGAPSGCEVEPSHSGPPTGTCALRFADGEGPGDVGECVQLCDCDDDCKNPAFICAPQNAEGTGRKGACYPKLTFNGITPGQPCSPTKPPPDAAPPGPDSGAGAGPDAGAEGGGGRLPALNATGGCDCRAAPVAPRGGVTWLCMLAAAGLLRRRRARC